MAKKNEIRRENYKNSNSPNPSQLPILGSEKVIDYFWLQSIFLASICLLFYANTFSNGYAVDDFLIIDKNDAISQGIKGIPKLLTTDVFDNYYRRYNANNQLTGGRYRPLSLITYAIEQEFFGDLSQQSGKEGLGNDSNLTIIRHINNVLLYMLTIIVLLYFLRNIVFPNKPFLAFFSTLLFAIHPIHTEVVANIKSRDEILSMLFIILTLIKAFRYIEDKKITSLIFSLFFFFLALLSKEYAVCLIFLVPLMFFLFKNGSVINCIKIGLPFLGVFLVYVYMRFSFVPYGGGQEADEILNDPYLLANSTQKVTTKIATLLLYIKLLIFPHPLCVDYSYNEIPYKNISSLVFWISFIFHLILTFILVFLINKKHTIAFAIAIYMLPLLLISNLIFNIGATMGERLIYHSSLGFSIVIAYLILGFYEKIKSNKFLKNSLVILITLIIFLSGIKTVERNKDWESNSTIYRKDVLVSKNSAITNANAGNAYLQLASLQDNPIEKKEMFTTALKYLNKAILIHTGFTLAYINRGNVLFQLGDLKGAKDDWDIAKKQYPTYPDLPGLFASYYINNAVFTFGSKGRYREAIAELNKGVLIDPNNIILLFNLGLYHNLAGNRDSAIYSFQKVINIKPSDTLAIKCISYIDILKKGGNK